MKDTNEIIKQLEILGSQHKKVRKLAGGLSSLTLLLGITSLSILLIVSFQKSDNNEILPLQLPSQSFSDLIGGLENEPMTDKRFELLEANLDSIPSNLSLNQLKDFIDLFLPENYKLNVLRLLQPKVTDNYSDGELEGFKKLFNLHKQSEVEELLPKRKK